MVLKYQLTSSDLKKKLLCILFGKRNIRGIKATEKLGLNVKKKTKKKHAPQSAIQTWVQDVSLISEIILLLY